MILDIIYIYIYEGPYCYKEYYDKKTMLWVNRFWKLGVLLIRGIAVLLTTMELPHLTKMSHFIINMIFKFCVPLMEVQYLSITAH